MWVVNKAMESIAESKAFHKEEVQNFADAVAEVGAGVEAVNLALEDTEGLVGRTGGFAGFFEGTTDVTKELVELGYTQEDVNKAIADGGPALEEQIITQYENLAKAAEAEAKANMSNESVKDAAIANMQRYQAVAQTLTEKRKDYVKGVEDGTIREKYAGEAVEGTTAALEAQQEALDRQVEALETSSSKLEANIDALEAQTAAQYAAVDSILRR